MCSIRLWETRLNVELTLSCTAVLAFSSGIMDSWYSVRASKTLYGNIVVVSSLYHASNRTQVLGSSSDVVWLSCQISQFTMLLSEIHWLVIWALNQVQVQSSKTQFWISTRSRLSSYLKRRCKKRRFIYVSWWWESTVTAIHLSSLWRRRQDVMERVYGC